MQRSPQSKFVPRQRGLWMVSVSLLLALFAVAGCKNERDRNSAGDETRGRSSSAPLGMVVTDQISPTYGDHTDWKSYAVPAPGVLAIRVYWDASDKVTDAVITVHDKYGMQLAERIHDPNVSIDELLVRVDQGFYYVKVGAERGESIYSIQGQHLLVSPSGDDTDEGNIPTMVSALDIQLPGAATAGAEGAAAPVAAEAGAGGAAAPNLAFIDDSNLGFLVPPDIDPEEPVRSVPAPPPSAPIPLPPPPEAAPAPAPLAVPPTPKPPAASMESFGEPTGERAAPSGGVGFAAGLDGPTDPAPAPAPPPAPAKVAEPVEAKIILAEASGPGTNLLLKCADDRVSEGQKVEVFDTSGKIIDSFSIMNVDGSRCSAESSRASSDFSSIGRVVIYIPN